MSEANNLREELKVASVSMMRTKEFEAGGKKFLAVGLVTGPQNRLIEESRRSDGQTNILKMNPRLIAMCIRTPAGETIWNVNDLTHLQEIDELHPSITQAMTEAANFVNGWSKEAVEAGKDGSQTPDTSSDSSSQES